MRRTTKPRPLDIAFVVSVVFLFASFCISAPASAATPNSAASSAAQEPKLTPEQQAYKKARDKCRQRYENEKIPRSQTHTFLNACMKDAGFKKAVPLPHPELTPPQPGK
jgi:hypothetical protein